MKLQVQIIAGIILALFVATFSFRLRLLDLSGAIAAFLIGAFIFGIGGWAFAIPILLFFVLSSLLSRILKTEKRDLEQIIAKGTKRDAKQVLANGLLPAIAAISSFFIDIQMAFVLYLAGIAAATADTWATEIGMAFSRKPRSILTGKLLSPGESGGVSFMGTLGAVLAATLISTCGFWIDKSWQVTNLSPIVFVIIAISAILAQFVDSLLGATIQKKNECQRCLRLTEREKHCGQTTNHFSGLAWADNDVVNFICSFCGIFFSYIMIYYLLN